MRIADRGEPRDERLALLASKTTDPVEQATHRTHAADRFERSDPEELVGARQEPARALETVGIGESLAQLGVVGPDRERDGEGVAVAGDAEVLHEGEVAAEFRVERLACFRREVVPAGEVHQATLVHRLGDGHVVFGQPFGDRRASAHSCDHEVGVVDRAVLEPDAGDGRAAVAGVGEEADDRRGGRDRHPRFGERGPAQHPFEGGTAHDEHRQILVAGLRFTERRRAVERVTARGHERVEHVGQVIAQFHDDPGKEAVGLMRLRRAGPLGTERGFGVCICGQRVPFEDRDGVARTSEHQGSCQPPDSPTDDDYFGHGPHPRSSRDATRQAAGWGRLPSPAAS